MPVAGVASASKSDAGTGAEPATDEATTADAAAPAADQPPATVTAPDQPSATTDAVADEQDASVEAASAQSADQGSPAAPQDPASEQASTAPDAQPTEAPPADAPAAEASGDEASGNEASGNEAAPEEAEGPQGASSAKDARPVEPASTPAQDGTSVAAADQPAAPAAEPAVNADAEQPTAANAEQSADAAPIAASDGQPKQSAATTTQDTPDDQAPQPAEPQSGTPNADAGPGDATPADAASPDAPPADAASGDAGQGDAPVTGTDAAPAAAGQPKPAQEAAAEEAPVQEPPAPGAAARQAPAEDKAEAEHKAEGEAPADAASPGEQQSAASAPTVEASQDAEPTADAAGQPAPEQPAAAQPQAAGQDQPAGAPAANQATAPAQESAPAQPTPAAAADAAKPDAAKQDVVKPGTSGPGTPASDTGEPGVAPSEPAETAEPVTGAPAEGATQSGAASAGSDTPVATDGARTMQEAQPVATESVANGSEDKIQTPAPAPADSRPADAGASAAAGTPAPAPVAAQAAPAAEEPRTAPEPAEPAPAAAPQAASPVSGGIPAARSAEPNAAADAPAPVAPAVPGPARPAADGAQPAQGGPAEPAAEAEQAQSQATVAPLRPAAEGYDEAERAAVHRVMRERRDIRNGFRPDPIPHEVLLRVLEAAHTAPSVGHSQPWDFVVIRSAETRRTMHELAQRQREAYAKSLPKARAKQFKELKIEAILDTPVNIVVTADPTRGGRHTLGRHTQPQMAPYSSALAVENLWLAARAEGLGVGWVSFFDEREMVRALGLPEHLEVVAYLCVGYVDEFPAEPELSQAGWSKRRPLSWVVHEETYGRRALPGEQPHDLLQETLRGIRPLDAKALGEAWERQKRMTKPSGALGMLEIISAQLCGLSRKCPPPIPEPAAVAIFAGDHGVHAQGVTAWPQEVTGQMVANFLAGGAVCNAFANQVGAEVCVVDVGVASELPSTPGLLPRNVLPGTADFTVGPAMSREDALRAIEVGIETARDLVAAGNKALLTGEMGIANTTASAALIAVYTGADPAEITGRGTGITDETLARKVDVVRRAIELHQPDPADPIGVLAAVGGLEHAALVGFLLGGASLRTPVILDGVSAGAAALVARAIAPEALAACIAGHRSAEPGHVAALTKLGLRPLVDLDLRLGEGTGALLALPVVQSAARAMHEVATFDAAGVTEKN
ncbi:nicotinate-nucleotide--dimethylbenzimidazole phosphoribosyltransferase [Streptomyces buecherae]|uniref:nicotinate-nucleotide--dimethylbenzimidazole phosphoribosyltransferase n=1 Tax=Streptomyces buecherae TaxID=2763006 RepID=UPI0028FCB190|nr:nicotinate-nucleotide--dimethylbenzimidazole phosphoribosyltransferase [Streptomyces buecherae]